MNVKLTWRHQKLINQRNKVTKEREVGVFNNN